MLRALVTCSTSGLGLEFAWQLAKKGYDLVIHGTNAERLAAIGAQIEAVSGVKVEILVADLAVPYQVEKVCRRLLDPVEPISLVVVHAGHAMRARFLDGEIEDHMVQLDSTIRSTMMLSHAAARAMVKRGEGSIINVSSMGAFSGASVAAASKCWVSVFTEGLANELEGTGVHATVLIPGPVHLEHRENAALNVEGEPRISWLKAPFVVRCALADSEAGEVVSIPSLAMDASKRERKAARDVRAELLSERVRAAAEGIMGRREQRANRRVSFARVARRIRVFGSRRSR